MVKTQKIYRERKGREVGPSEYPAEGNDNITQGTSGMVHGFEHGHNPHIEALLLHALCGVIESEERRCRILRTRPLEPGLTPRRRVANHQ